MKVLIICTGNTCRSQMAEGFLKHYKPQWQIFSAGTNPGKEVNPYAIKVMNEISIDIKKQKPKNVKNFVNQNFDYVITVCDKAKEQCPIFYGKVKHRIHIGFRDPAEATGSEQEILKVYRNVRDGIVKAFTELFKNK